MAAGPKPTATKCGAKVLFFLLSAKLFRVFIYPLPQFFTFADASTPLAGALIMDRLTAAGSVRRLGMYIRESEMCVRNFRIYIHGHQIEPGAAAEETRGMGTASRKYRGENRRWGPKAQITRPITKKARPDSHWDDGHRQWPRGRGTYYI